MSKSGRRECGKGARKITRRLKDIREPIEKIANNLGKKWIKPE
jgi:hypothetical protein